MRLGNGPRDTVQKRLPREKTNDTYCVVSKGKDVIERYLRDKTAGED